MDWNSASGNGNVKSFGNLPNDPSFTFLYNCNYDQYSGTAATAMSASTETLQAAAAMGSYGSSEKKKRLTNEQLESLERSFQEEIKLDPDRKMRLSRELGLQPRQVAVWFQNRRARWKTKQLERLYDGLKQEFDAISREKLRLQEEVLKLKSMLLREQGGGTVTMRKKVMASSADHASGDQTAESSWRRYESALIT